MGPLPPQIIQGQRTGLFQASRKWLLPGSLQPRLSTGQSAFAQITMQHFLSEFLIFLFKKLQVIFCVTNTTVKTVNISNSFICSTGKVSHHCWCGPSTPARPPPAPCAQHAYGCHGAPGQVARIQSKGPQGLQAFIFMGQLFVLFAVVQIRLIRSFLPFIHLQITS